MISDVCLWCGNGSVGMYAKHALSLPPGKKGMEDTDGWSRWGSEDHMIQAWQKSTTKFRSSVLFSQPLLKFGSFQAPEPCSGLTSFLEEMSPEQGSGSASSPQGSASSPQTQVSIHFFFSKSQVTHLLVLLVFNSHFLARHVGPYRGPMELKTL